MEGGFVITDGKSFECLSPSELDRKFFGEQSLLSALSLEQLSAPTTSIDKMAEGSGAKPSILASLCQLSLSMSPSQAFVVSSLTSQETHTPHLAVPLQGKSSTPYELLPKHKLAASFNQSYVELTASQMSWDVSLINPDCNSPKPCTESSALESTWSPKPQSSPGSLAEISSLIWSGTPPAHI